MSNLGLYKSLERENMNYEQTAVGDKYVAENMMENGYSLGGEQSGHIISAVMLLQETESLLLLW